MTESKTVPVLFDDKKNCCACGACVNACPKDAVAMKEDEHGFLYPAIDADKCIRCGKCQKVCAYQNIQETHEPLKTWVAVSRNDKIVMHSASGGVFSSVAAAFINSNGYVCGAAFDDDFTLRHILTDDRKDLVKLRGSKYTQSSTDHVFREIKEKLLSGEKVLFSGCPCQVAGLRAYLGKEYDNLFTMDLVCHGVPSNKMFRDYIGSFEKKHGIKVKKFLFRDKKLGWGKNGSLVTDSEEKYKLYESNVSYFYYFGYSLIMRENCYSCKYANEHRPGDITIGDYWGIQKEHPEILIEDNIDESKGVSVIIANTSKGIKLMEKCRGLFHLYDSEFEKAAKRNPQLCVPTKYDQRRESLFDAYTEGGWEAVEARFNSNIGLRRYSSHVKSLVPKKLKRIIKQHLK